MSPLDKLETNKLVLASASLARASVFNSVADLPAIAPPLCQAPQGAIAAALAERVAPCAN